MRKLLAAVSLSCTLLLGTDASAQSCSDLTITGTGAPGTDLTFAVSGAPARKITVLFVSEATGTTSISFGTFGTLDLGLASPMVPLPLGFTDSNGDLSRTVTVPNTVGSKVSLFGQATSVDISFQGGLALKFCTSDVEGFSVGS